MKAQVITRFGDPSVFETKEVAMPVLKPGYVIIRVMATSVNPVDCKIRAGKYPSAAPEFPAILHGDVAGVIEHVSEDVTEFKVGDEVYGCAGGVKGEGGALAEFMLADAKLLAKKPQSLSMAESAALPLVSITAWEALMEKTKISPGEKILVHGGAGGVGHIGVQIAKWAGADVYATASSAEKAKIAKSLGATDTINYQKESVEDYVNRLTAGKGFDLAFDTIGGENIDKSLTAIGLYGSVVTIQARSTHDLSMLQSKSANLYAVFMLLPMLYNIHRECHGTILKRIANLVDEGHIKPLIDSQRFSFEEVGKAHALLESGKAVGKVIITRDACLSRCHPER